MHSPHAPLFHNSCKWSLCVDTYLQDDRFLDNDNMFSPSYLSWVRIHLRLLYSLTRPCPASVSLAASQHLVRLTRERKLFWKLDLRWVRFLIIAITEFYRHWLHIRAYRVACHSKPHQTYSSQTICVVQRGSLPLIRLVCTYMYETSTFVPFWWCRWEVFFQYFGNFAVGFFIRFCW